jgi:hypothetical protein
MRQRQIGPEAMRYERAQGDGFSDHLNFLDQFSGFLNGSFDHLDLLGAGVCLVSAQGVTKFEATETNDAQMIHQIARHAARD